MKAATGKAKVKEGRIAVVGMSCRFPDAPDYRAFWENLANGRDSVRELPPGRWDPGSYFAASGNEPGKSYSRWGAFLDRVDAFDNGFFGISPREARSMDPQQRVLLEEAWHCLEDAAIAPGSLRGARAGTFVGFMAMDYHQNATSESVPADSYSCSGNYACILSNRLSYFFGWRGPSLALDAACASSLVALHHACRSLESGECDYALAAGVSLAFNPWKYISFSKARMLSPDGRCKTFDKDANGYVPGEGTGLVLLRRVEDAIADGNRIHGIIRGTAVNHNGRAPSLTAPSLEAQQEVITAALAKAGLSAADIGYVEAHGTGTSLGDPIEVEALSRAFGAFTDRRGFCGIGSVKTNIGHLEAAAGMAGLIKVLLMMRHRRLAPTLHLKVANPMIDFAGSPFRPVLAPEPWLPDGDAPLRAGVSSFGFGGVNSHAVVEEWRDSASSVPQVPDSSAVLPFLLSARSAGALEEQLASWERFTESGEFAASDWRAICRVLMVGRDQLPFRTGAMVRRLEDIRESVVSLRKAGAPPRSGKHAGYVLRIAVGHRNSQEGGAPFRAALAAGRKACAWGTAPSAFTGEGAGFWAAAVLAGVLGEEEAAAAAESESTGIEPTLHPRRPKIVLLAPGGRRFTPIRLQPGYLVALLREMALGDGQLEAMVEKAKLMWDNQFTFRKHIEEWRAALGRDREALLRAVEGGEIVSGRNKRILLYAALRACIQKTRAKWSLAPEPAPENAGLGELLDLLADGIVEPADAGDLLDGAGASDTAGWESLAARLEGRIGKMDADKPYPLLTSFNLDFAEAGLEGRNLFGLAQSGPFSADFAAEGLEILVTEAGDGDENKIGFAMELWKRGFDPDWSGMQSRPCSTQVQLPGYAFERNSFWIERDRIVAPPAGRTVEGQGSIGMVLDKEAGIKGRDRQDDGAWVFDPRRDPILRDHLIAGRLVVPGASFIDFALAHARAGGGPCSEIAKVAILNPALSDGPVTLTARSTGNGRMEVRSGETLCCTAIFRDAVPEAKPGRSHARSDGSGGTAVDVDAFYAWMGSMGYAYGPGLRVIKGIRLEGGLLLLHLEDSIRDEGRSSGLSPYLLDGVFQAGMLGIFLDREDLSGPPSPYIPFLIRSLRLYGPLSGECRLVVARDALVHKGQEILADFRAFDESGTMVLSVEGMSFRKLAGWGAAGKKPGTVAIAAEEHAVAPLSVHRPIWTPRPQLSETFVPAKPDQVLWLLVLDGSDFGVRMRSAAQGHGIRLAVAEPAEAFCRLGHDHYGIDFGEEGAVTKLLEILAAGSSAAEAPSAIRILHVLGEGEPAGGYPGPEEFRKSAAGAIRPVFQLCKAVSRFRAAPVASLTVVARDVHVVLPGDAGKGYLSAMALGLLRVQRIENRKTVFRFVDVGRDEAVDGDLAARIMAEAGSPAIDPAAAYRHGLRYALSLATVTCRVPSQGGLRGGGTYLVAGGAGGFGLAVCRHLAVSLHARIVVIGRSEPGPDRKRMLEALEGEGASVAYVRADLSDYLQAEKAVAFAVARFGRIDGIFHCGGVLEDQLLFNKSWESFERVLAPKVIGGWNLERITRRHVPGILVLFSSTVALTGNLGQSDYAASNAFLDAFAQARGAAGEPVLSVNWTLLAGGGMGSGEAAAKQLQASGMRPIDPARAIEAMEACLSLSHPQIAITDADAAFLHRTFPDATDGPDGSTGSADSMSRPDSPLVAEPAAAAGDALEATLRRILADVLSMNPAALDADTAFPEIGMDSVAVIEAVDRMEEALGIGIHHSDLIEHPTVNRLAACLRRSLPGEGPSIAAAASRAQAARPAPYVLDTNAPRPIAPETQASEVECIVRRTMAQVVSMEEAALDRDTPLNEFGVDSVAIVEIVDRLEGALGLSLHHSLLTEYPSIAALSDRLAGMKERAAPPATPAAGRVVASSPLPAASALRNNPASYQGDQPIAVVAAACRFPSSPTPESFWQNLREGRDLVREADGDRSGILDHFHREPGTRGKTYSRWAGFLEDIAGFDPDYFKIRPENAAEIDPQQRMFLEVTDELLKRAGYSLGEIRGMDVGLFVGAHESGYGRRLPNRRRYEGRHGVVNVIPNMVVGRVADFFDFRGPAETVYTACSSSLVAIHNACQKLRAGECRMAVAGGIELLMDEEWFTGFSQSKVLSPGGRCRVFDESADGFVLGEGAGAVLLKTLDAALEDGDQVLAVVRGSAVNNDGYTMGLTTPNLEAQKRVIRKALENAKVDPSTITCYEAHGTATALGDPIEIKAATQVYRDFTGDIGFCSAGSVKSNMGHSLAAAGVASFIKVLMALVNGEIPPTLHCAKPHQRFQFGTSPFRPALALEPWLPRGGTRRAALSSFGFGGTNCHMVLEEYAAPRGIIRQPLPATVFARRRYWLGTEKEAADGDQAILQLLKRVEKGEIPWETAASAFRML